MKIIFMGSPEFALPTLKKLYNDTNHEIIACYSQPAKAKNRGKKLQPTPVAEFANTHNLKLFTPTSLKSQEEQNKFTSLNADISIVAAYGLLLPDEIIAATKFKAINIHPSKLPRFRGAAPIQRTIMSGDKLTSVCIMQMTKELDAGDIILEKDIKISENMTAGELHDLSAEIGADLISKSLVLIASGQTKLMKQSSEGITYANKINKDEALIDFSQNGKKILNLIHGLNPSPGAFFYFKDKRIKIFRASFQAKNSNANNGEIINKEFHIKCNDGIIIPQELQLEGKKKQDIKSFLPGFLEFLY